MGFRAENGFEPIGAPAISENQNLVAFVRASLANEVYRTLKQEGSSAALCDVTAVFDGVQLWAVGRQLVTFADLLEYVKLSL